MPTTTTPPRAMLGAGLTDADVRMLQLLATGMTVQAAAYRLGISGRTIRRRTHRLCDQLGMHSTIELLAWAARHHVI